MVAGLRSMGSNKRCMQSASPTLFIPLPKGVAEGRGMFLPLPPRHGSPCRLGPKGPHAGMAPQRGAGS